MGKIDLGTYNGRWQKLQNSFIKDSEFHWERLFCLHFQTSGQVLSSYIVSCGLPPGIVAHKHEIAGSIPAESSKIRKVQIIISCWPDMRNYSRAIKIKKKCSIMSVFNNQEKFEMYKLTDLFDKSDSFFKQSIWPLQPTRDWINMYVYVSK
jgi:hypothetical protein